MSPPAGHIVQTRAPGGRATAASCRRRGLRTRLRRFGLLVTAFLPLAVKRQVYRWCFGYRIGRSVAIGIAYLDCQGLAIAEGARIGHGVVFWQCGEVEIGRKAIVGPLNLFRGGERIHLGDYSLIRHLNVINAIPDHDCTNQPDSSFHLGFGSVVTGEHRIDFTDRVSIGRCTVLGGRNSSIWTHTFRIGKPVEIGSYCYLGSEVRMAPGTKVPDCSIVGMGSVVTRPVDARGFLIAGVPATKKRRLTAADRELVFRKTRADLPDEEYPPFLFDSAASMPGDRHVVVLRNRSQQVSCDSSPSVMGGPANLHHANGRP